MYDSPIGGSKKHCLCNFCQCDQQRRKCQGAGCRKKHRLPNGEPDNICIYPTVRVLLLSNNPCCLDSAVERYRSGVRPDHKMLLDTPKTGRWFRQSLLQSKDELILSIIRRTQLYVKWSSQSKRLLLKASTKAFRYFGAQTFAERPYWF